MADKRMAKAQLRPRRRLSPREIDTLRVGLQLLRDMHCNSFQLITARHALAVDEILSDDAIDRLLAELETVAEVSVCLPTK